METPRLDTIRLFACLSGLVFAAGCAGGSDGSGTPGAAGSSGGGSGGAAAGTSGGGGAAGSGIAGAAGNTSGNAGSGGGVAGSPAGTAGGGAGGSPAGTAGSSAGSGGSAAGTGGSAAGTGGSSAGRGGSGGSAGGAAGRGGSGGGAGGQGGGGPPTCPANMTFCSGFETAGLPSGAAYFHNAGPGEWTRDFAIDTSVRNSGNSSLRVKSHAEAGVSGAYKMLAVPATMNVFWVRLFVRSDMPMGIDKHNVFGVASVTDQPNDNMGVEFAEDVGIAFNASDTVRWPDGYGRLTSGATNPYMLTANTWHCVEISFDGTNRVQQLFVNGAQLINATNFPSATRMFRFFKFGYNALNGTIRQLWYDDVAVAPTRIGGC